MNIRYQNALLWRGGDHPVKLQDFDVLDGLVAEAGAASNTDLIVDLKHKFVMPAFRDGHCHPLFAGREHVGPDVTQAKTLAEIGSIIRDYAQAHPSVFWIDGAAYDRSIAVEFTRHELDAIFSDRPIVLHGADHHTLWVNTLALEQAGLMDSLPELNVGSIDLADDGKPNGMLREWDAMQLVLNKIPPLTMDQELDALDWAQSYLIDSGVVEVQDAWIDPGMTEIYLESARRGRLKIRTNLAFRADPISWRQDFEYFASMRSLIDELNHPMLRANAIKFFIDGVLGSSTASVLEPYVAGPKVHTHGEPVWDPQELLTATRHADELGYQLHLHAIGDAGVRAALDAIEAVSPKVPGVIAHTELVSDEDIPRFRQLNVTANFEPLWAREDGQLLSCVPQVGRERIDKMYRMRDLADSGAIVAFGSDWPVSSPVPLEGIATAVNRSLPGGVSWTKHQALTTREALVAYTSGVCQQLAESRRTGTLETGQPAEFVVLSANPFEISEPELFGLRVLATSLNRVPLLEVND